jgi:hypothetical protein
VVWDRRLIIGVVEMRKADCESQYFCRVAACVADVTVNNVVRQVFMASVAVQLHQCGVIEHVHGDEGVDSLSVDAPFHVSHAAGQVARETGSPFIGAFHSHLV